MIKLLDIINKTRILYNVRLDDGTDGFPGGGGGGGDAGTPTGGTGGSTSGTTSSIIIPTLSLSPNTDQSIAVGTTLCLNASGVISLPQEPEQTAIFDVGCATSYFYINQLFLS